MGAWQWIGSVTIVRSITFLTLLMNLHDFPSEQVIIVATVFTMLDTRSFSVLFVNSWFLGAAGHFL